MDEATIQRLIAELDGLVPKDQAFVHPAFSGGVSIRPGHHICGNKLGLLRLGVEALKAAVATDTLCKQGDEEWLDLDLSYLANQQHGRSGFSCLVRNNCLGKETPKEGSVRWEIAKFMLWLCFMLTANLVLLLIIGVGCFASIRWLLTGVL